MIGARDAALVTVFGRRGSGKSTLARALAKHHRRVVAIDPARDFGGAGWRRAETVRDVAKVIAQGGKFQVAFTPDSGTEASAVHRVCNLLIAAQADYFNKRCDDQICLLVDEANLSVPVTELPAGQRGVYRVINQGRHYGINGIAVTQRPALLSAHWRGNSLRSYMFAQAEARDVDAIAGMIGREHRDLLKGLPPFEFVLWENGKISRGKTLRNGRIRG